MKNDFVRKVKSHSLFLFVFAFSFSFSFSFISASYGQDLDYSSFGMATTGSNNPHGLKVGDKAPDFTGYDQDGKQIELKKILEKGPVILFFYRGKWCPVCSRYLNNYQDSLKVLTDQGFNVLAITPESIENVEQTVKLHHITFTVIYDCQEKIMKDYDVMFTVTKAYQEKTKSGFSVDIAQNNGRDEARLPVPATYIINRDGIIVAVQFDPDYKNRASVKWMLKNLGLAL
jgi:peroxiredoxin